MAAIIAVNDLTKSYGRSRGVTNVTFNVDEGEIFGFLGPNGAGKTTTIRVLMGLLRPTSGGATIAGHDVWRESVEVKKIVGYLPSDPQLEPDLTGGQIIDYFSHLRGGVDQAYVKSLVDRFELDTAQAIPRLLAWQQAEGWHRPGVYAQAEHCSCSTRPAAASIR